MQCGGSLGIVSSRSQHDLQVFIVNFRLDTQYYKSQFLQDFIPSTPCGASVHHVLHTHSASKPWPSAPAYAPRSDFVLLHPSVARHTGCNWSLQLARYTAPSARRTCESDSVSWSKTSDASIMERQEMAVVDEQVLASECLSDSGDMDADDLCTI